MTRLATLKDVAELAGISVSTASRCLNHPYLLHPETVRKVEAAAEQLGFLPNALARGLVTGQSGIVGLIVPDITNPGFGFMARGCEDALREHGLMLIISNSDENADKELEILRTLETSQIDGLIYASNCGIPSDKKAHPIQRRLPTVYLERSVEFPRIDGVFTDNESVARLAVEYLLKLGHQHIAVVTGFANTITTQVRQAALRRRLNEAGIELSESDILEGDFKLAGGQRAAEQLLKRSRLPTAVYVMNDLMAYGLIGSLASAGVGVPDEVSVLGTDNLPTSEFSVPPLTTIANPLYELGREGARLLMSRIERPALRGRRKYLPVRLVERGSCRPLAKESAHWTPASAAERS
jgi:LacI family transcriptional regulator